MLPLPPHHTTMLVKAYLPCFLLPSTSCPAIRNKFYKTYQKPTNKYNLKTRQTSGPDLARMSKLSDQEFETTMINMLRSIMDKLEGRQEHMGNVNKEMEVLRTKKKY